MKFKQTFVILVATMLLGSCNVAQNNSGDSNDILPSSSSSIEKTSDTSTIQVDYGKLNIEDFTIYLGNSPKEIKFIFTKEEYKEEITYEYDEKIVKIEDGKISAIRGGVSTIIKATTSHHQTSFNVSCVDVDDKFKGDVAYYLQQQKDRNVTEGSTLFAGDSFFDYRYFWTAFYDEMEGNIYNTGIGATNFEDWLCYAERLIYNVKPKNIVIHLGTNDFYDIHRNVNQVYTSFKTFMTDVHENLPEAKIYYFSVENRTYSIPNKSAEETIEMITSFNEKAQNWCSDKDFITFIDSWTYFTNEDGSCNASLFSDGVHPIKSEYKFYISKLIENGCSDISFASSDTIKNWQTTSSQSWSSSEKLIKYKDQTLVKNYVISGKVNYNFAAGLNAHIGFSFSNINNRFLLWNCKLNGYLYYTAAFNGNYYDPIAKDYNNSNELTWKVLVSDKNAYLFVNDTLEAVMLNLNNTSPLTIATENINASFTDVVVALQGDGTNTYENLLASGEIASYENNESVTKQFLVV